MVRSAAFSCNSLWTNFAADGGVFEVRRYKTKLLMRRCLFRNELFAHCMLCFFFLWKVNARSLLWTAGDHEVRRRSRLNKKTIFIFKNRSKPKTRINRFCQFIAQPYHILYRAWEDLLQDIKQIFYCPVFLLAPWNLQMHFLLLFPGLD